MANLPEWRILATNIGKGQPPQFHDGLQSHHVSAITLTMHLPDFIAQNLVHVAALSTLMCYLFRDQIKLRIFASVGDLLLSVYYYVAFAVPLWNPMVWSLLNVAINTTMIILILRDGREGGMSDVELSLFRNLDTLTPGQFRKLVKAGTWHHPEDREVLTTEGENLTRLYYVLDGNIDIQKANRSIPVEPNLFIGELAFMRKRPATATVAVGKDTNYMCWNHDDLEVLFRRNEDLRTAMTLLMGKDIAEKMART